jgi:hypothetical protein
VPLPRWASLLDGICFQTFRVEPAQWRDDIDASLQQLHNFSFNRQQRCINHRIRLQRNNILHVVTCSDTSNRFRMTGQCTGITSKLAGTVHSHTHEFEIGMRENAFNGSATKVARGPLRHAELFISSQYFHSTLSF